MSEISRSPTDGKPFYCRSCGAGFSAFMTCEQPDYCKLESSGTARNRQLGHALLWLVRAIEDEPDIMMLSEYKAALCVLGRTHRQEDNEANVRPRL